MEFTAKELIELTKEIDQKCIDFAEWIINDYYTNPNWESKTINELLEIYKKTL